jgi:protein tyrosine/serine phosphatase
MDARTDDRPAGRLLEGAPNFRDLGGLPTTDGRVVRAGVLFRSSGLEELTAADVAYLLDELGLRTVFDLRSHDDHEIAEPLLGTGIDVVSLPIVRDDGSPTDVTRPMRPDGRVDIPHVYARLLDTSAERFAEMIDRLTSGATPAVFHCVSGKDRTGVMAAVLLDCVRVDRQAIVADFMQTSVVLDELLEQLRRRPAYAAIVDQLPPGTLDVEPWYITDLLAGIDAEHGGVRNWLLHRAGVGSDALDALADLLLEGNPA